MVAVQAPTRNPSQAFLNIADASQYLGVTTHTLRKEINAGRLPVLQIGRQRLIPLSALEARCLESGESQ